MRSTPENSIVSFSADLDRLLGVGFPLGQVTELCALHFIAPSLSRQKLINAGTCSGRCMCRGAASSMSSLGIKHSLSVLRWTPRGWQDTIRVRCSPWLDAAAASVLCVICYGQIGNMKSHIDCRMQLAVSVQLPREVGGLAGEAVYLGELTERVFSSRA